jgi:hypothetical protein
VIGTVGGFTSDGVTSSIATKQWMLPPIIVIVEVYFDIPTFPCIGIVFGSWATNQIIRRWANEHKHAAAAILDKQTFYLDVEDTYRGIKHVDMVPNLSPRNLAAIEIGKDFMLSHAYIRNDFDVRQWAAPEFLEKAARELLEERWQKVTTEKLPAPAARLG